MAKAKPKSKLRAIDTCTAYDVAYKLKWLSRQIETGEITRPHDAVVILRSLKHARNGDPPAITTRTYQFGTGDINTAYHMLKSAEKDVT